MGLFSRLKASWNKSSKIKKLQMKISPPNLDTNMVLKRFLDESFDKDALIQEYLDICEEDEGVHYVMKRYNLNRDDLENMYIQLSCAPGQWIKGHYIPLSSITFYEPIHFYAEMLKRNSMNINEIAMELIYYWKGQYSHGGLLNKYNIQIR